MRRIALLATLVAAHSGIAVGDQRVIEPTMLESYVARPSVVVESEAPVGSIASADAKVTVAALVAADTANPPDRRQGLRLRFENNAGQDEVYLDEVQVAAAIEDLRGIEGGIPELKSDTGAPWRVQGTASCWMPDRPLRILCPSYGVGPDGSGLWLAAYGASSFSFPGHRPAELVRLMEAALAALAAQPPAANSGLH